MLWFYLSKHLAIFPELENVLDGHAEHLSDIHGQFQRRVVPSILEVPDGLAPYPDKAGQVLLFHVMLRTVFLDLRLQSDIHSSTLLS